MYILGGLAEATLKISLSKKKASLFLAMPRSTGWAEGIVPFSTSLAMNSMSGPSTACL